MSRGPHRVGGHPGIIRTKLSKENDELLSRLVDEERIPMSTLVEELDTTHTVISKLLYGGTSMPDVVERIEKALGKFRKAG